MGSGRALLAAPPVLLWRAARAAPPPRHDAHFFPAAKTGACRHSNPRAKVTASHLHRMKIFRLFLSPLLATLLAATSLYAQDADVPALRAKAEKGNAIAQYNLGLAYAEGHGVAADPIEAYVWLSLAKDNGARGQALNLVITQLDIESLAAAKLRLDERRAASNFKPAALEAPAPAVTPTPSTTEQQLAADKKQLSAEVAQTWKEIDSLKTELARAKENSPTADQLRRERDALAAKLNSVVAEIATLRADRERLQTLAVQTERGAGEQNRAAQEKARLAEIHATELQRELSAAKSELDRTTAAIASQQPTPKAAVDNSARELQSTRADLDAAHQAQQQLGARLERTESDKVSLEHMLNNAQTAALESGKQVDALKIQLAAAAEKIPTTAVPVAPAYPDLSGRVHELEAQLAAATTPKPAAPAYPDLSAQVAELQQQLGTQNAQHQAALSAAQQELAAALEAKPAAPAAPAFPDLSARVHELETQLAAAVAAPKPAAPAYPDLSGQVKELQAQLAAVQTPAAPTYPDLAGRVRELEAKLAAPAKPAAPAYPDLTDRVRTLETSLAEAQTALHAEQTKAAAPIASASTPAAATADASDLAKELAETKSRLETALRGYTLLAQERDDLATRATKAGESLADAENRANAAKDESARLDAGLTALQRSTSQTSRDYASQQALLQQMRGANTVLAQENYQLKATLARDPNAPRNTVTPVPVPTTATPAPAAVRTHTVVAGDSLSKISLRYYGTANRWREILQANPGIVSPTGVVRVGTTLRIP